MSYLFVSGWLRGKGKGGIGQFIFDSADGSLKPVRVIDEDISFGASIMDAEKGILYALCNKPQNVGLRVPSGGAVYVIRFDKASGDIIEKTIVPIYISNPCHLNLIGSGRFLLVSGHGTRAAVAKVELGDDGEYHPVAAFDDVPVMLISVNADGSLGRILDVVKHEGSGPLPKQQTAHPHCVVPSPYGKFFVVCDKGLDSFFSYSVDAASGKIVCNGEPIYVGTTVCPRYSAFHPVLPFVYHNSETSTDIYAYKYDESCVPVLAGKSAGVQFADGEESADGKPRETEGQGLDVHPSGKWLYNVTHGTNTVDVFALGDDGSADLIQSVDIPYAWPRGQVITSDGRFLLLSCADGGKVIVFAVGSDGRLTATGCEADFENAECLTLWE